LSWGVAGVCSLLAGYYNAIQRYAGPGETTTANLRVNCCLASSVWAQAM